MSKREFDARVRKAVRAIERLRQAKLTRGELLSLLHTHDDQNVVLDGSLIDHLNDRDARTLLQVAYRALEEGATFVFSIAKRTEPAIRVLCAEAGIGDMNVKITRDARSLRVALAKLQS